MNIFKQLFYKIVSRLRPDVQRDYRLIRRLRRLFSAPAVSSSFVDYCLFVADHKISLRMFAPSEGEPGSEILLFIHGGGFVTGDIDTYTSICRTMADETGRNVISVDYRLAPEHPFPAGLYDCYQVWLALQREYSRLKLGWRSVVLVGDSAGANLAAALSLLARDRGVTVPVRQILLYPLTWYDHSESSPFPSVQENGEDYVLTAKAVDDYLTLYLADQDPRSPYVAPLLAKDFSDLPETLVVTAEFDVLRDEGAAFATKLMAAGTACEYACIDGAVHGFISFPRRHESVVKCYSIINRFLDRQTTVDGNENGDVGWEYSSETQRKKGMGAVG
ncbi:MAG TPA: alpha/beta hydrolase [Clostridiaceae bacterium]|nr:alpha/beta hydrolase [Clostridiaceae bacterium]